MSDGSRRYPEVVVGTSHPGKLLEIRAILGDLPVSLRALGAFPEVHLPEEGDDYERNALGKARAAARDTGRTAIADDTGLEVAALGGAPGPHTARYGGIDLDDAGRVGALLEALDRVPLAARTARLFQPQEEFGAWIHETHHAAKIDAPSGTALALRQDMVAHGYTRPIDMASTRVGAAPGTHTVGFDGPSETITLTHTTRDRATFARGALEAARWVHGRHGWFSMRDVLGLDRSATTCPASTPRSRSSVRSIIPAACPPTPVSTKRSRPKSLIAAGTRGDTSSRPPHRSAAPTLPASSPCTATWDSSCSGPLSK